MTARAPRPAEQPEYDRGYADGVTIGHVMTQGQVNAEPADLQALVRKFAGSRDTAYAQGFEVGFRDTAAPAITAAGLSMPYAAFYEPAPS